MDATPRAHPQFPNVLYALAQSRIGLSLHLACQFCGDVTEYECSGAPGMPQWRVNEYANQHSHGRGQIANPMPRSSERAMHAYRYARR